MAVPPDNARKNPPLPNDPLAPFKPDLLQHFPGKEALLREGKAYSQRRGRTSKAAVTCLGVAVAALWLADPAWQTTRLATRVGERSTWTLRDGSRIQLNTDSVMVVENHLRSRRIALERGEAMFTVSHSWRAFVVTAAGVEIRDIGTHFNVRRAHVDVDVAVMEGAVEIKAGASSARVARGQALAVHGGQLGPLVDVQPGAVAWAKGKLVLDGSPLRLVVAEMQRYRDAPIRLRDEHAGSLRLSGEYDIGGLEPLLDALPAVLPVRVARHADGTVDIASR